MNRLVVLLLAILVPLQFAWAGAHAVRGHMVGGEAGYHVHEHDHGSGIEHEHADEPLADEGGSTPASGAGEHADHNHPMFTGVIAVPASYLERRVALAAALPPLASFASHTPPPFDRPPAALA